MPQQQGYNAFGDQNLPSSSAYEMDATTFAELQKLTDSHPGNGWTNGDVQPSMRTVNDKLERFGSRRWIGLSQGWTRIGEGHEHDAKTSESKNIGGSGVVDPKAIKSLIAQLCEFFYQQGWATGTGGGCSIRVSDNGKWRVFVAPSGIQKEDMIWQDIFELDMNRNVVQAPITPGLRQSASFRYVVYKHRPSATCVIHTHSMAAVQATLLDETASTLKITYLEMLKGVGNHAYDDMLEIPIIDNRPSEDLLADQLEAAIIKYPNTNAALVRRHGLYVWGDSWEQAKTQAESFDYLLQAAVALRQVGVDCSQKPTTGTYRDTSKKRKVESTEGFNGLKAANNDADLATVAPLLPRDPYPILLLDIEGCTTSISFVKDLLFPYCAERMQEYCAKHKPANHDGLVEEVTQAGGDTANKSTADLALWLMERDVKSAALKDLQGQMWKAGYSSGELKGHVYPDFEPLLKWLQGKVKVCIYSSGSIQAQKLLFGNSIAGDLLPHVSHHFDIPTAGPKKVAASYTKISQALGVAPSSICFVSDVVGELSAAREAGIGSTVLSIRPGNAPVSEQDKADYPVIHSLLQLCGAE